MKLAIVCISILMISLSFIQGANFPAPFVVGGNAEGAVVNEIPNIGFKIDEENYQAKINCKNSGCFLDKICYPYGHIRTGKYCAEENIIRFSNGEERYTQKGVFIYQKKIGVECNNDFECLGNLCLRGICKNRTEEIDKKIETELGKQKEELEKQFNEKIEKLSAQVTLSLEEKEEVVVEKNIIEKIIGWFGRILE